MRATLLFLIPALAACQPGDFPGAGTTPAAEGPLRIVAVDAAASRVTFRLSNGARCTGARPEGERSGWTGVTDPECGYQLPYTVVFRQGGSAQRFTIEDPQGVLGRDGTPGARAEVFVTDVDGQRRLFVSPLGVGTRISGA